MSLKRYAAKRDQSEPAILKALASVGADYIVLDKFDVLVFYRGGLFMLENKTKHHGRKALRVTGSQRDLVVRGWPLHFVQTPEQALVAIGALPRVAVK